MEAIKVGYDARDDEARWTFPGALMFCLSVFTMIGFGNIVPRSEWGKIATMCYAMVGIPLYILYFLNMGEVSVLYFINMGEVNVLYIFNMRGECG